MIAVDALENIDDADVFLEDPAVTDLLFVPVLSDLGNATYRLQIPNK